MLNTVAENITERPSDEQPPPSRPRHKKAKTRSPGFAAGKATSSAAPCSVESLHAARIAARIRLEGEERLRNLIGFREASNEIEAVTAPSSLRQLPMAALLAATSGYARTPDVLGVLVDEAIQRCSTLVLLARSDSDEGAVLESIGDELDLTCQRLTVVAELLRRLDVPRLVDESVAAAIAKTGSNAAAEG